MCVLETQGGGGVDNSGILSVTEKDLHLGPGGSWYRSSTGINCDKKNTETRAAEVTSKA